LARKLLGSDRVGCTNPIPLQMQLLRRVGRVSELHRLPRIPPDEWKLEKARVRARSRQPRQIADASPANLASQTCAGLPGEPSALTLTESYPLHGPRLSTGPAPAS